MTQKQARAQTIGNAVRATILAAAAHPKGFAIAGHNVAQYHCNLLMAAGKLYKAAVHVLLVRYFTTPEAAAAFMLANPWKSSKGPRNLRPTRVKRTQAQNLQVGQRKAYSQPAPRKDAVIVHTAATRYSSSLMPPPRNQVVTHSFMHNGMGAM
jgi:hypothetical protein